MKNINKKKTPPEFSKNFREVYSKGDTATFKSREYPSKKHSISKQHPQ
jgi:hypothetical protein